MTYLLAAFAIVISVISVMSGGAHASHLNDFMTAEEYYEDNLGKAELLSKFSKIVSDVPSALPVSNKRHVKIGIIYPGIQKSDYWERSIIVLKKRLEALGVDYSLQVFFNKRNFDSKQQAMQIRTILDWDADYLIYTVDTDKEHQIAEQIINLGKPKLILNNNTLIIKKWGKKQPLIYAGFDHADGASRLSKYFKRKYPIGSSYALFMEGRGAVSKVRAESFVEEMDHYHNLTTTYMMNPQWGSVDKAVEELLESRQVLHYIYTTSTDLSVGISKALARLGRSDIEVIGWGGSEYELKLLADKELGTVLFRINDDVSIAIAEAIKLDISKYEVPLIYRGEFSILSSSTSSHLIERIKKRAYRYSGL